MCIYQLQPVYIVSGGMPKVGGGRWRGRERHITLRCNCYICGFLVSGIHWFDKF